MSLPRSISLFFIVIFITVEGAAAPLALDTLYGTFIVDDPLAIELIESAPFQRLKGVHQYGFTPLLKPTECYTRYIHSIGVYYLLNRFGCSREEQIAGLLHDVSHTVFSHVGDYVFGSNPGFKSYQDDIHSWYLQESGLASILMRHGFKPEDLHPENPQFSALKTSLPNLSADRIDYNLQGGVLRGLMSEEEFQEIISALSFEDGAWHLNSVKCAKKLAEASLIMTETLWGSPWESLVNRIGAKAIKRALDIGIITFEEFHFSTDDIVWEKLVESGDLEIAECLAALNTMDSLFMLTIKGLEDFTLREKFRGLNPLVITECGLFPLTALDIQFNQAFLQTKTAMENGWPIKWIGTPILAEIH